MSASPLPLHLPPPLITLDRAERGKTPRYLAVPVYCRGICRHFAIIVGTKEQNCPAPPIHTQTTCLTLFHYSIGLVTPCCTLYQSRARNNTVATTRPCFQATQLFVIAILLLYIWFGYSNLLSRHRDLNIFRIFSGPRGSITLSRCCIVVVAKLYNCRVPSSALYCTLYTAH